MNSEHIYIVKYEKKHEVSNIYIKYFEKLSKLLNKKCGNMQRVLL